VETGKNIEPRYTESKVAVMRVSSLKLQTLLLKVSYTRDQEASCDDCARLSARLAEALMSGPVQDQELLSIVQHLIECFPCAEEFTVLQQCAQMDAQGSWPAIEELWHKLEEGLRAPPQT
jgi:hypothetical protein